MLRCIEAAEAGLGVTELARRTGLTMSTSHRLARALAEDGLLAQDPDSERYVLGPALIALGRKAEQRLGYRQALPLLTELATATGESVNLGIRAGNAVHVVLAVASRHPLRFDQESGSRIPLHASAMGKCLLAGVGDLDDQLGRLGRLAQATQRTITDVGRLRAELEAVRERGWALNDEERNPGVRAIAAPVRRGGGEVVAAVAIQGPTVRLTDERLPELAGRLAETVGQIAPLLPAHR